MSGILSAQYVRHLTKIACAIILFISPTLIAADSALVLKDYSQGIDFTGTPAVKAIDSDKPEFAQAALNDEQWKTVSLPANSIKLFPDKPAVTWFRIHVKFPAELPVQSPGIQLGIISDTDSLYFNGTLIGATGSIKNRIHAYDKVRMYEIPVHIIKPGADNVFALRTERYFRNEGGPYQGVFRIVPMKKLYTDFFLKEFVSLIFIIPYLFVAVYFAFIFITRSIDREYLFFSLFTAVTSVYLFFRTQFKYVFTDNFDILKLSEYFALLLIPLFMMEYVRSYFVKPRRFYHYAYYGITLLGIILIAATSSIQTWNDILFYIIEPSWSIPVLYCTITTAVEFKRNHNAKYLFLSYIIVGGAFINDVLFDRGILGTARISHYAFLAVVIGTAIIIRNRFRELYEQANIVTFKRRGLSSITPDNKEKMEKTIAYLQENYRSDIAREGLAAAVDMNSDYFGKLFKQYTGSKIGDYINELRVEEACRLLLHTETKVIDVAFSVGFESLSTFYRIFQSIKKEKPVDWQKRNKSSHDIAS